MTTSALNSTLYHFWPHGNIANARFVLNSIFEKGLLLTTNSETLDTFKIDRGEGVFPVEIMQKARACFTDIPFEFLASHGERYGKYGIGFKRETIVGWGGLPAWYLPNHWDPKTLKIIGPVLVNGLHAAIDAVTGLKLLAKGLENNIHIKMASAHGPTISGDHLQNELQSTADHIFTVLSFIKEMSPSSYEDFGYLCEREWRLICAFNFSGQPSIFRALTEEEKEILCTRRPAWREKRNQST